MYLFILFFISVYGTPKLDQLICGVLIMCTDVTKQIKLNILIQNLVTLGQCRQIWIMVATWPQLHKQLGEACEHILAILAGPYATPIKFYN